MSREEYFQSCCGIGCQPRPVVKCDKLSMEILERFDSARAAEKAYGLSKGTVANYCRKHVVSAGAHVWRFEDEYDKNESFDGHQNRPLAVLNIETHELLVFMNTVDAAEKLQVNAKTLQEAVCRERILYKKYIMKYAR